MHRAKHDTHHIVLRLEGTPTYEKTLCTSRVESVIKTQGKTHIYIYINRRVIPVHFLAAHHMAHNHLLFLFSLYKK